MDGVASLTLFPHPSLCRTMSLDHFHSHRLLGTLVEWSPPVSSNRQAFEPVVQHFRLPSVTKSLSSLPQQRPTLPNCGNEANRSLSFPSHLHRLPLAQRRCRPLATTDHTDKWASHWIPSHLDCPETLSQQSAALALIVVFPVLLI